MSQDMGYSMNAKVIKKEDIADFLDTLLKDYEVFAPVKRDRLVVFDQIHSGREAFLTFTATVMSPKEILLPQSETLFTYSSTDSAADLEVPSGREKPRLIFGIHPCDVKSLVFLDRIFNEEEYKDVYYLERRKGMVVVSMGCIKPRLTCFCTSVGGGPFSTEGSDLQLVDIGDEYVVQVLSDKGEKLLGKARLEDAGEDKVSLMRRVAEDAEASMAPKLNIDGLKEKLDKMFDDPIWDVLTEKCLSCGVCTYLCPTCYCFDIVDEARVSGGERIRLWDSCQFPLFTLQASGENPRPTSKERYRQRIMHKFSYLIDNCGRIGCVGCGRCVTECPVNLDIRQIITAISNR
jgi:sulfhydrogenase subunit beta (sulfur reductase)